MYIKEKWNLSKKMQEGIAVMDSEETAVSMTDTVQAW